MKTSAQLQEGEVYSRKELMEIFDIKDATIRTGVFSPKGHDSVWLFVTEQKTPDRTQYIDHLDGDTLHWQGQTEGRTDHLITGHRRDGSELLLFYRRRKNEYPGYGFRYEGVFEYVSHRGSHPTSFVLRKEHSLAAQIDADLAAAEAESGFFSEGGSNPRLTNHFERNRQLRIEAVSYHGTTCMVCGFNFEETYGALGRDFIEVHHLVPVSTLLEPTTVNPRTDMVVVCANCHRMLHRRRDVVLSVKELRESLRVKT